MSAWYTCPDHRFQMMVVPAPVNPPPACNTCGKSMMPEAPPTAGEVWICPECSHGYVAGIPACPECDPGRYEDETEKMRVLLVLGGDRPHECEYCGELLLPEQRQANYAHAVCEQVVMADDEAAYVHDNGDCDVIARKLRVLGRCSYQIRAPGWDGGGVYCGQDTLDGGDRLPDYCPEHEGEVYNDADSEAEERSSRTRALLRQYQEAGGNVPRKPDEDQPWYTDEELQAALIAAAYEHDSEAEIQPIENGEWRVIYTRMNGRGPRSVVYDSRTGWTTDDDDPDAINQGQCADCGEPLVKASTEFLPPVVHMVSGQTECPARPRPRHTEPGVDGATQADVLAALDGNGHAENLLDGRWQVIQAMNNGLGPNAVVYDSVEGWFNPPGREFDRGCCAECGDELIPDSSAVIVHRSTGSPMCETVDRTPVPVTPGPVEHANGELSGDSKYRAATAAMGTFAAAVEQYCLARDTMEAELTSVGFDRDPELQKHIDQLRDYLTSLFSAVLAARERLDSAHSGGAEYHERGDDADEGGFR